MVLCVKCVLCMRTMYIISLAFPWTIYIDKIKWRNKNGNQNHDELWWSARPPNITFRLIDAYVDAYILDLDVLKVVAVRWWLSFIHRTLINTLRLHLQLVTNSLCVKCDSNCKKWEVHETKWNLSYAICWLLYISTSLSISISNRKKWKLQPST